MRVIVYWVLGTGALAAMTSPPAGGTPAAQPSMPDLIFVAFLLVPVFNRLLSRRKG